MSLLASVFADKVPKAKLRLVSDYNSLEAAAKSVQALVSLVEKTEGSDLGIRKIDYHSNLIHLLNHADEHLGSRFPYNDTKAIDRVTGFKKRTGVGLPPSSGKETVWEREKTKKFSIFMARLLEHSFTTEK